MEKELESEVHGSELQAENCSEQSSREINLPSNEMGSHAFAMNSNISNELNNEESHQFSAAESMIEDDEEESPLKSFSCVDYLEIMHEEMLNPESNNASEPDAQEEGLDLVCKQSECNFSTTDMDAYLKHEYEHIDGKSYECDVCHVKFSLFASMRNHRMLHLSHRPYKCRLCSKEFFRKDILVEHLVKQHSKQRPYRCPFCPKHFKLRPQLKLHLSNEHSAAMLIKTCKLCGFKAISPNAFRSHFAICYMKRSREVPESNGFNLSQIHLVSSEANAIDLGTVSQNFSFVPSHYAPYAIVAGEGSHSLPGPSDTTQVVSLHTTSAGCSVSSKSDREHCANDHRETATPPRISSLASSTTPISPSHTNSDEFPQNLVMTSVRAFVKSEPAEVRGEDSQNGNALPTSTMDLSSGNVVETSYISSEATCCETSPDLPVKIKAACSSREERATENCRTQFNSNSHVGHSRECYTVSKMKGNNTVKETVCRCSSSSSRHSHVQRWNKVERQSDSNTESESEVPQPDLQLSRKRLCRDKATTTESFSEAHFQNDIHHATTGHPHIFPRTPGSDCCGDTKSHILIKSKVEGNSHTCPFCEIVFPDQTLYFLHRSLHSEAHPWKCNLCGKSFKDKYDFNSHIISQGHR